ncbi:MAG: Stp1/IreP family PP2C-type Ser/Thr phosphatase [Lachnospiraceae bacterium]|nr:Stp1/IreP family PP2C-type Ser/Thr phosphatase [Lachnospiraceae bacterium]
MKSCALTDVGQIRKNNQDFVFAQDTPLGSLPNFYMVADGMGGHQGGGFASRYTVERMVELIRADDGGDPIPAFSKAIQEVNRELYQKACAFDDLHGMGTTLVCAVIDDGILYVANIGDSRLYMIGEEIRQITKDHSWVEEMVAKGRIERDSELFIQNKNVITRAVGVRNSVTADFFEITLTPGSRILLCSDGLSNMVDDEEIKQIVNESSTCQEAVLMLLQEGNRRGGQDNISIVVVDPETGDEKTC